MSSLTDPKGINATVNAIYEGGREHPLAHLVRVINEAIEDAQFQGLAEFDVARWVAHAITEDQKARIADADKTAPHGKLVPNPPKLSVQALAEILHPNPSAAARAYIDHIGPDAYKALVNKHMTPPAEAPTRSATTPEPQLSPEVLAMIQRDPRRPKPFGGLLDSSKPLPCVDEAGEYPPVEWDDSRPVTVSYRQGPGLWDFLKDLPTLPPVRTGDQPSMFEAFKAGKLTFGELPELPIFDLSDEARANLKAAGEQIGATLREAAKESQQRFAAAREEQLRAYYQNTEHEHVFGRGSNGICRLCGAESNSRRARAKRRAIHNEKAKAAAKYPQHQRGETVTASSIGPDGARITKRGTVLNPADHTGMVGIVWEDQEPGTHSVVNVHSLSNPESRLYEALKAKGDGHE